MYQDGNFYIENRGADTGLKKLGSIDSDSFDFDNVFTFVLGAKSSMESYRTCGGAVSTESGKYLMIVDVQKGSYATVATHTQNGGKITPIFTQNDVYRTCYWYLLDIANGDTLSFGNTNLYALSVIGVKIAS